MTKRAVGILALMLAASVVANDASAQNRPHAGMLRYADIGPTHIVFSYANDLWTVPREGGVATPLASPPGAESFPKFSPDGKHIGFVGNYDGNRDVYTVPADGGVPQRVTFHPGRETLADWSETHGLLFFARREDLGKTSQLYVVGPDGGLPEKLPVPYGAFASIRDDGEWLAYIPYTRDQRTWKRYRGGMATDIWLFNLKTKQSKRITDWEGTDSLPMWVGSKLYFLSDREGDFRLNIWSYDPATDATTKVTDFSDYDVKWPSAGPGPDGKGEIVFQYAAGLWRLYLADGTVHEVKVTIPGARPTIRAKRTDVSSQVTSWDISPTGKRVAAEARGDIWTLPAKDGAPRNLTRSSGTAERDPSWSPDGRWIAYFSDKSGEYELQVTQSDGKGETRALTSNGNCFKESSIWSPDSKHVYFADKTGTMFIHTVESETTTRVDQSRDWGGAPRVRWSPDSRFLTYARSPRAATPRAIWIYDVEAKETKQVTSDMFDDGSPTFDRKGEWLYFVSTRNFNPTYSNVDTTFVYRNGDVILAVPLKKDQKSPWAPKSDEEEWEDDDDEQDEEDDESKDDEKDDVKDGATDDAGADAESIDAGSDAAPTDPVSGTWSGRLEGGAPIPSGGVDITLELELIDGNRVTGSMTVPMGSVTIKSGTYDAATGIITIEAEDEDGVTWSAKGEIKDGKLDASITASAFPGSFTIDARRTATSTGDAAAKSDGSKGGGAAVDVKVEIDFDGFERRAIPLPITPSNYGQLAVNHAGALIYVKRTNSGTTIHLYDIHADKKAEKKVADGGGYALSANGKKMIIARGRGVAIQNAGPGSAKTVSTAGMFAMIEPREEWNQIFNDVWRLYRDYFYVANMHGVDWEVMRESYAAMLEDCVTRGDVSYVIRELISELNVGHAYYRSGPGEPQPQVSVGMLGVDFELANGAYRIARIHEGGPWDSDARGPLSQPGVDVETGDYLLAVNGLPLDPTVSPWAAFQGIANKTTTLTVSEKPMMNDDAREVLVKPRGDETYLRYRSWIEDKRAYVAEKTNGRVGYIYVPDTGRRGQNELFRQFYGQIGKEALIIDERWNGGGQIPTRFIELLNRPRTNYWATRDSHDMPWPPDSHQGPKCMLINGRAGSGGDAFPAYFRQSGLGKLIGTRTWGGLVGISGNPGLIDGASVTVPTFGYYEKDGTWGIEGHGVDPDLEVIDDPALMVDGGDPQLDAAIKLMLEEADKAPYRPAARPGDPDRSRMGVTEQDK